MGRAGGLIIGGPGIIGMWPPMGGLIPGAAGQNKEKGEKNESENTYEIFMRELGGTSIKDKKRSPPLQNAGKKTYLTEEMQQIHHIFKLLRHSQTKNKKKSTQEPYGNHNLMIGRGKLLLDCFPETTRDTSSLNWPFFLGKFTTKPHNIQSALVISSMHHITRS